MFPLRGEHSVIAVGLRRFLGISVDALNRIESHGPSICQSQVQAAKHVVTGETGQEYGRKVVEASRLKASRGRP